MHFVLTLTYQWGEGVPPAPAPEAPPPHPFEVFFEFFNFLDDETSEQHLMFFNSCSNWVAEYSLRTKSISVKSTIALYHNAKDNCFFEKESQDHFVNLSKVSNTLN